MHGRIMATRNGERSYLAMLALFIVGIIIGLVIGYWIGTRTAFRRLANAQLKAMIEAAKGQGIFKRK
jgi:membrane protein DedA with SNARE-associated domain